MQLVTTYHPGKSQYSTALKVSNQPKNRSPDLLASDSSRVFLSPIIDAHGDDYINASWISGKNTGVISNNCLKIGVVLKI